MTRASVLTPALLQLIAADADTIDEERKLTPSVVQALHEHRLLRALIPRNYGGLELEFPEYVQEVKTLAMVDASTAWCVNQGAVIGTSTLWLEPDVVNEIWRAPDRAFANGPPLEVEGERVEGGMRVSGLWGFSSGCQHATMMCAAIRRADRAWRMVFFEPDDAEFEDDWQVAGLRGTGSFKFRLDGLKVPEAYVADMAQRPHTDSRFYRIPVGLAFAVSFAGVALGVARHGLDLAVEIAEGKSPVYAPLALKNDPVAHDHVGRATARYRAADAYLRETVATIWEELEHQDSMMPQQRASLRLAGTHIIREAVAVMEHAYALAASTAIYQTSELHRPYHDLKVIAQHVQGRLQHYQFVGRYLVGHPYEFGPMG